VLLTKGSITSARSGSPSLQAVSGLTYAARAFVAVSLRAKWIRPTTPSSTTTGAPLMPACVSDGWYRLNESGSV
jgi:hypothetical protein